MSLQINRQELYSVQKNFINLPNLKDQASHSAESILQFLILKRFYNELN